MFTSAKQLIPHYPGSASNPGEQSEHFFSRDVPGKPAAIGNATRSQNRAERSARGRTNNACSPTPASLPWFILWRPWPLQSVLSWSLSSWNEDHLIRLQSASMVYQNLLVSDHPLRSRVRIYFNMHSYTLRGRDATTQRVRGNIIVPVMIIIHGISFLPEPPCLWPPSPLQSPHIF